VKAWRRLQALGAVAVKSSVYALPAGEQAQEDFEWLLREIVGDGGEGLICEARLVEGLSDAEVRALFDAAREADYDGLAQETRALDAALRAGTISRGEGRAKAAKLRANLGQIAGIDFFGANGREVIEGLLGALEHQLRDE
jgi:hypothetical protein